MRNKRQPKQARSLRLTDAQEQALRDFAGPEREFIRRVTDSELLDDTLTHLQNINSAIRDRSDRVERRAQVIIGFAGLLITVAGGLFAFSLRSGGPMSESSARAYAALMAERPHLVVLAALLLVFLGAAVFFAHAALRVRGIWMQVDGLVLRDALRGEEFSDASALKRHICDRLAQANNINAPLVNQKTTELHTAQRCVLVTVLLLVLGFLVAVFEAVSAEAHSSAFLALFAFCALEIVNVLSWSVRWPALKRHSITVGLVEQVFVRPVSRVCAWWRERQEGEQASTAEEDEGPAVTSSTHRIQNADSKED